jgi:hypothetical protein
MTRHLLGVLGVIAASVLLVVSAMMNYRFGYTLGKTPSDGHIYGLASAAADCFKALVPFFFFAAWRNRMWSQALAAMAVWLVVTGYSMTSALGHAALNRLDTSGVRAMATTTYKDLREDLKRTRDQLSWLPPHRAAAAVQADLEGLKSQFLWHRTGECNEPSGKVQREFCQGFRKLEGERANALQAEKFNAKIEEISVKLAKTNGATVMGEADPQASVLSKMTGVDLETIQMALTLFVALLIEIGSGFGMYVAFAYWRTHAPPPSAPAAPAPAPVAETRPTPIDGRDDEVWTTEGIEGPPPPLPLAAAHEGANDNMATARWIMPENDVELFYKQGVSVMANETTTSQDLYDGYKLWSKSKGKRPLNHSRFSEEFERLGYTTVQIAGRQRYVGLALAPELLAVLERKPSFRKRKAEELAQQVPDAPIVEQPKPAPEPEVIGPRPLVVAQPKAA